MGLSSITNIPAIMGVNGWHSGAALMTKWFSGPPMVMPSYTTADTSTIKMDAWALKFARAKSVFDNMVSNKVWSSPKAKAEVWPKKIPVLGYPSSFDLSTQSAPQQHDMHVNHSPVEIGLSLSLDDMEAALGNFSIYVAPMSGEISPESGRFRVKLMSVGFHIMDSYDFEGDQSLGYWNESDNSATSYWTLSGTHVTNQSFRDWRKSVGRGGDFQVYSDIKTVSLNPPDSFLV
jgi:hypothetical protein